MSDVRWQLFRLEFPHMDNWKWQPNTMCLPNKIMKMYCISRHIINACENLNFWLSTIANHMDVCRAFFFRMRYLEFRCNFASVFMRFDSSNRQIRTLTVLLWKLACICSSHWNENKKLIWNQWKGIFMCSYHSQRHTKIKIKEKKKIQEIYEKDKCTKRQQNNSPPHNFWFNKKITFSSWQIIIIIFQF